MQDKLTWGYSSAGNKCITSITRITCALRCMICYMTCGMNPTYPRTGIFTFVVDARLVIWTLRVDCTFGFTLNIGISNIVKYACAWSCTSLFRAFSIPATWWRIARLYNLNWSWGCYKLFVINNFYYLKDTTYLMAYSIVKMDPLYNQQCKYKLEYDFSHCILHLYHKDLDKDLDISCWCMLYLLGNHHLCSILVYSLVVNQSFQANMCIDIYPLHF